MAIKPTEMKEIVKIPEGIEVTFDQNMVRVKGAKGTVSRILSHPRVQMKLHENIVEISCADSPHRKEKALIGTFTAHIRNMINGVTTGYQYTMKTVYSHFPIKTTVEGNVVVIQNFLGERSPRKAQILEGVKVEIQGDKVLISGIDIENIGQTAANIEKATKVRKRDVRVFQDGIYITSRGG